MKALTTTLKAEYDSLPNKIKEKISYGDYCNDPNIKTYIETAKNIAIGRMAVAIQRRKGNFRN